MSDTDSQSWLSALVEQLLENGAKTFTLDEIGEAIGERKVGSEEVEELFQMLEKRGATIVEPGGEGLVPLLQKVIRSAHAIRAQGERPTPAAIAKESGMSARAVRVALLYADVLKG